MKNIYLEIDFGAKNIMFSRKTDDETITPLSKGNKNVIQEGGKR